MKMIFGKRQLILAVILLAVGAWRLYEMRSQESVGAIQPPPLEPSITATTTPPTAPSDISGSSSVGEQEIAAGIQRIEEAFYNRQSNVWVIAEGTVFKSLTDDTKGSQHQRFLVELETGRTLLFAHNIDLAPRVPFRTGDRIIFRGEYEWNEQGGVVHWTHHDPQGRREGGWIEHQGKRYE